MLNDDKLECFPMNLRFLRTFVAIADNAGFARAAAWAVAAWDPQRFLPHYAAQFVEELVAHCRRGYPGHEFSRRAPPLPRPREANN
jgi:hypothetical protein